jgi:drug/metabolite transporter (DMT)-like permease
MTQPPASASASLATPEANEAIPRHDTSPGVSPSPARARAYLVGAAFLWSLGSFFMRVLLEPTGTGLDSPKLSPLQIAFFRGLFAGLILVPLLRRRDIRFRPVMLGMMVCFGTMSALYLSALGGGQAANAILLQNTAPLWVYLIGVYLLGEPADRRNLNAILVGLFGMVIIVAGNWNPDTRDGSVPPAVVLLMGLGSGITYAGVVLFLRGLRHESSAWLMVLNLLGGSALIASFIIVCQGGSVLRDWFATPSVTQFGVLAIFATVQMAAPYWLFARGLRTIGPQEAGIITLLEPVLNPVWAYLIAPEKDTPTLWTFAGGILLLGALAWRYIPRRRAV